MSSASEFVPLTMAVLSISDTRTLANDTSGQWLADHLETEGHQLVDRKLVTDDRFQIRSVVSQWIADPGISVILTTGGTGFAGRDSTPEAIAPLLEKTVEGFGELFRQVSYEEIGSSTIQSRALGGLSNHTLVFCLPGSTNACATGWNKILREQLDARFKPCNFVKLLQSKSESH